MKTSPKMDALLAEIHDSHLDDPKALPQRLIALLDEGFTEEEQCVFLSRMQKDSQVQRLDFPDLTAYECFVNHIHVEDYLENGGLPPLELLGSGMAFASELRERLRRLHGTKQFHVIVASGGGPACTVRFHTVRNEEEWVGKDSNGCKEEVIAIIETQELQP
ncbi:MAG TPA: hypothetical protein VMG82_06060 [Candidatus Sulfotelmatobacter sp.]|nr:hypothetical protein [Candidatus Sulfotelmatobacter sp.]